MFRILKPVGICLAALALPGCGRGDPQPAPPPTFVVKGTVLGKDGKPFSGGVLDFRLETRSEFSSRGQIRPDGHFELFTIVGNKKIQGAQEGTYSVTIFPISKEQGALPIHLKKKYTVKPEDNDLTILVE